MACWLASLSLKDALHSPLCVTSLSLQSYFVEYANLTRSIFFESSSFYFITSNARAGCSSLIRLGWGGFYCIGMGVVGMPCYGIDNRVVFLGRSMFLSGLPSRYAEICLPSSCTMYMYMYMDAVSICAPPVGDWQIKCSSSRFTNQLDVNLDTNPATAIICAGEVASAPVVGEESLPIYM